jgi:EmrB/QacA subfamily drug resistance transporter
MTKQQRVVLLVSIFATFVAGLDGSAVTVALPAIANELGGGLVTQQWVVDAYLITLGALMLIAGSLSDIFGRKKTLAIGLAGFGITSLLCAVAPTADFLIIARAIQGVSGALLVPSSLALIIGAFSGPTQSKAIGTWTAWTGIAYLVGPLLGGVLVDLLSWRLIFAINIPAVLITLFFMRSLQLPDVTSQRTKVDLFGTALCAVGLGGPVYALIEQAHYGWASPMVYGPLIVGILSFAGYLLYERRSSHPMLPLDIFKVRNFAVGNIATTVIYAALSIGTFLVTVFLQQVWQFSAVMAGLALLPVTLIMFSLSSRFGALAGKFGPRFFMGFGPILGGLGFLLMMLAGDQPAYWQAIFPGVVLFGVGLSITVAPLTAAVLGSIKPAQAGIGSAVNNAVARVAGLVGVATLGIVIGTTVDTASFQRGVLVTGLLLIAGGLVSVIGITNAAARTGNQSKQES